MVTDSCYDHDSNIHCYHFYSTRTVGSSQRAVAWMWFVPQSFMCWTLDPQHGWIKR